MSDIQTQQPHRRTYWQIAPELPQEVFAAWRKPNRAISPVAIIATVDSDGTPRAAPFGSLQAVTPRLLRLCSLRDHDTYANLCRDGRAMVALVSPPDIAVSVRGRARVIRERMNHDEQFAILEIDVEEVKNDMPYRIIIESAVTISAREKYKPWYDAAMDELESVR
jgi:flavin reductase (DIM6/NTAB) family NADH-FMN oxidoreductase RutF